MVRRHRDLAALYGEAPTAVAEAFAGFDRQVATVESALSDGRPFLLGDIFTGADILLGTCLQWAAFYGRALADGLSAYSSRVLARPACAGRRRSTTRSCQMGRRGSERYDFAMCRNIHTLHNFDPPATAEEIRDAALQYVRKVSGYTKPPAVNREAFDRALEAVTQETARMLSELVASGRPRTREHEAEKARERWLRREAAMRAEPAPRGGARAESGATRSEASRRSSTP